ncbi:MAG: hypothetical protein ACPGQD_08950, partial [Planctomycetota bacterium]
MSSSSATTSPSSMCVVTRTVVASAEAASYLDPLRELLADGRSLGERKIDAFRAAGGIDVETMREVLGPGCCAGYPV